jgi:Ca2+-binding EF-hand superfamily protein
MATIERVLRAAALFGRMALGTSEVAAQGGQGQGQGRGAGMQDRIAMLDTDGDGLIQKAELVSWRETVFLTMDADGDDALTREEYMAVQLGRGADPEARGPRYDEMQAAKAAEFDAMDSNGDGSVPRDDFIAFVVTQFQEADANGDGALTAEEFRAMHGRP